MNTWKAADAVGITTGVRAYEGGQRLLEDLDVELTDAGRWDR